MQSNNCPFCDCLAQESAQVRVSVLRPMRVRRGVVQSDLWRGRDNVLLGVSRRMPEPDVRKRVHLRLQGT